MEYLIDTILGWFHYPGIDWISTDAWIAPDKVKHFVRHFVSVLVAAFVVPIIAFGHTAWLAILAVLLADAWFGFVWEMYDSARGDWASWKDIVVNEVGAFSAVVVGVLYVLIRAFAA